MRSEGKEILEVFSVADERPAAPALAAPAAAVQRRSRRWMVPAALVVLAGGTVAVVTSGNDRATAPTTTPATTPASTPPSTAPISTTPSTRIVLPVLADPPPGYGIAYAQKNFPGDAEPGITELWSSPGTGGTWFMVTAREEQGNVFGSLAGDRRVRIGDGAGVVSVARPESGQLASVEATTDARWHIGITGAFDVDELVSILDGLTVLDTNSDGSPDELRYGYDSFESDHHLVTRLETPDGGGSGLYAPEDVNVSFTPPDTSSNGVWLTTGPALTPARSGLYDYFLTQDVPLRGGAITARFGQLQPGTNELMFDFAGINVTVTGDRDLQTLVDVAETVHFAGTDEWNEARTNAHDPAADVVVTSGSGPLATTPLAGGTLDNQSWSASVYDVPSAQGYLCQMQLGQAWMIALVPLDLQESLIQVQATDAGTFVTAVVPRDVATGATMQVLVFGEAAPIVVELSDADPSLPWFAAVVAFSELNPWQAQIVAADGTTVLATVTSDLDDVRDPSVATEP